MKRSSAGLALALVISVAAPSFAATHIVSPYAGSPWSSDQSLSVRNGLLSRYRSLDGNVCLVNGSTDKQTWYTPVQIQADATSYSLSHAGKALFAGGSYVESRLVTVGPNGVVYSAPLGTRLTVSNRYQAIAGSAYVPLGGTLFVQTTLNTKYSPENGYGSYACIHSYKVTSL